jgi:hypothetical protein
VTDDGCHRGKFPPDDEREDDRCRCICHEDRWYFYCGEEKRWDNWRRKE